MRLLVGDDYDTEYFKEDPLVAVRGRVEVESMYQYRCSVQEPFRGYKLEFSGECLVDLKS